MPYLGRSPGTGVRSRYIYTATASQTAFSGADDNGATLSYMDGTYVDVYMNGVLLKPVTDYAATTKTSIVLTANAAASDLIEIITYDVASIADTVSKANGGTFDANVTIAGNATISDDLTVDTSTLVVDATNNRVGVGNAAPNATLDVNGTIKLDGNYPVGTSNVALGDTALDDASFSGANNVAVGHAAMSATTSGNFNSAVGAYSLSSNTTGSSNASSGSGALENNTTGSLNSAFGRGALQSNTTASNNTAVGYQAGYTNSTGLYSSYFGFQSGYLATGTGNTFIGYQAGYNSTGTLNTFVGNSNGAGNLVTTGSKNTILGGYNGNQGGLDIRTSSNNIVLSDGDGNPRWYINSSGDAELLGNTQLKLNTQTSDQGGLLVRNGSNNTAATVIEFQGWNSTTTGGVSTYVNSTTYNTSSDYRLKENVVDLTDATLRLKQLKPKQFNFIENPETTFDGFLAHEVQEVVPQSVTGTKDGLKADGTPQYQGIDHSHLVPLLVATIKELEARITALENA